MKELLNARVPAYVRLFLLAAVVAGSIILVIPQSVHADTYFLSPVTISGPSAVSDITTGDFNQDGKRDVASVSEADGSFSVAFGNGDGTFGSAATLPLPINPSTSAPFAAVSIESGDFDNDGHPDLVFAVPNADRAVILWGSAGGSFSTSSNGIVATPSFPTDAAVVDLNGDGIDDFVTANNHAQSISAFLSNGGRGFTAGSAPLVGNGPSRVAGGSVFTDADVMVINRDSGNMRAVPGDGSGGFQVGSSYGVGRVTPEDSGLAAPSELAIGDINGDGRADVVTSNPGTNSVTVLYNIGSGYFWIQQNTVLPTDALPSGIATGDFNADGQEEAAVVNRGLDTVSLLGWGGATDTPMTIIKTFPAGGDLTRVTTDDFNQDGISDLAIGADGSSSHIRVLIARGRPTLSVTASASVELGGALSASATLDGGTANITGALVFKLYKPSDTLCAGPAVLTNTSTVSGNGQYPSPSSIISTEVGTYRWTATYTGDSRNDYTATTSCEASGPSTTVVRKRTPSVTHSVSDGTIEGPLQDDAALSNFSSGASGYLRFDLWSTPDCSGTPRLAALFVPSSNGLRSITNTPLAPGTYRWTASYPGDAENEAFSTSCGAAGSISVLSKRSPNLTGNATDVALGGVIADTAVLSGSSSAAGGTITFDIFNRDDCSGTPAYSIVGGVAGPRPYDSGEFDEYRPVIYGLYHWVVSYSGDSFNEPVSTACGAAGQTSIVSLGQLEIDRPSLDFGSVTAGLASGPQTVTITNKNLITSRAAGLGSAALGGTGFSLVSDNCSGTTLAPGESCTLQLAFAPTNAGAASGSLTLSSVADPNPVVINLGGIGAPAPLPPLALSEVAVTRCLGSVRGAKKSVKLGYSVNSAATVKFTLQSRLRPSPGLRRSCPAKMQRDPAVRGSYRTTTQKRRPISATRSVTAGAHSITLKQIAGRKTLAPGRYRVLIEATASDGSKTRTAAYFWVLKQTSKRR